MKLVVPVGLRQYPESDSNEPLFVAHTLDPPYVSAAASSADVALTKIRDAVRDALERAHPRMLPQLGSGTLPDVEREQVPLYRSAAYDWQGAEQGWAVERTLVHAPVDVATRPLDGGLFQVAYPVFEIWTLYEPTDDDEFVSPPTEPVEGDGEARTARGRAIRDLADALRGADRRVEMHRPTPTEFSVIALEIEFEALDLSKVEIDAIWMTEFARDDFEIPDAAGPPATPTLDEVAQCWTACDADEARARGLVEAFGRGGTVSELTELMEGEVASPVVIVGPSRVGKTALVKHMAWRRIGGQSDSKRRIWFADPPRMVSTDAFSGDWRDQCQSIVAELEDADDILYLGRVIEALDAGKYVGSDYNLAQFLKPALSDRRVRVVAEATPEEWNDVERRDIGFARTFTILRLDDPADDLGRTIVSKAVRRIGEREDVATPRDAIDRAWALQKRFATEGSVVGRTIDFIRRTIRIAANAFRKKITREELVREFCKDTGLPPLLLLDDRQLDIDRVRQQLAARVMGQEEAVHRVADVVGITKAGLSSPDRPLGSFLFVGPTGVGKTELARALASYLFGDEDRMVRIDMSEYAHRDAYARLIGEGREDGDLTGPIRRQPFSLILLDEIEKANPSVFDLLLQVLGEARLTDVNGRTTTFRNAIVIMTSNLGVDSLRPAIGFGEESVDDAWASHFRREAERFFRPEFLARIDQFIPFRPLSEEVVTQIASRELAKIHERDGLRSQDVELVFGERVEQWIAARGWDPRYGARPLKRVIEHELVAQLARRLAETRAEMEPGVSRSVKVTVPGGPLSKVALQWTVEMVSGRSTEASARRSLLEQLARIANLRRRLQRYMHTAVFGDLEWQVENFDVSSQSKQFWEDPNASRVATDAEHARRVVEPAISIAGELAALEDLANEAYHGRSFALSTDIDERMTELAGRVRAVVMAILRGAYESPDSTVLYLVARPADEQWRRQLVRWYQKRARSKEWELTIWRSLPDRELAQMTIDDNMHYDDDRTAWERVEEPEGAIIALELEGYAARPLSRAEGGLHRLISPDGNAVVDVFELDEYAGWPWPQRIEAMRSRAYVTRTYNERTREITMPATDPVRFDVDDPFPNLESVIEDAVWRITESEWG